MFNKNGTYYTEEHSVSFGELSVNSSNRTVFNTLANTWTDWHLIPSSRPAISNPSIITKFVEIPGADGALDLTTYLTGRPVYGQRTGSLGFIVDTDDRLSWEMKRTKIANFLHGKKIKMRLEDDPTYYYEGRFTVGNWTSGADNSSISIDYNLDSYKYKIEPEGSDHPTLWDPFNFETDYDYYSVMSPSIVVNGSLKTFNIYSDNYPFTLFAILVSGHVYITFGGVTKTLSSSGTYEIGKSSYGLNQVRVNGIGEIKLEWRGGAL